MSAWAIWAFLALGLLFIGAVVLVVRSVMSLFRSGRTLAEELAGLSENVEQRLSAVSPDGDGGTHD